MNEEDLEDFQESTCECALCKCMNTIYTRWENWQPESRMKNCLKRILIKCVKIIFFYYCVYVFNFTFFVFRFI